MVRALTGYAAFLSNYGDPGETGRAVEQCRQQVASGSAGVALQPDRLRERARSDRGGRRPVHQGPASWRSRTARCLAGAARRRARRGDVGVYMLEIAEGTDNLKAYSGIASGPWVEVMEKWQVEVVVEGRAAAAVPGRRAGRRTADEE